MDVLASGFMCLIHNHQLWWTFSWLNARPQRGSTGAAYRPHRTASYRIPVASSGDSEHLPIDMKSISSIELSLLKSGWKLLVTALIQKLKSWSFHPIESRRCRVTGDSRTDAQCGCWKANCKQRLTPTEGRLEPRFFGWWHKSNWWKPFVNTLIKRPKWWASLRDFALGLTQLSQANRMKQCVSASASSLVLKLLKLWPTSAPCCGKW